MMLGLFIWVKSLEGVKKNQNFLTHSLFLSTKPHTSNWHTLVLIDKETWNLKSAICFFPLENEDQYNDSAKCFTQNQNCLFSGSCLFKTRNHWAIDHWRSEFSTFQLPQIQKEIEPQFSKSSPLLISSQGVNVFRLNFSFGSYKEMSEFVQMIRSASEKLGKFVSIMGDLQVNIFFIWIDLLCY